MCLMNLRGNMNTEFLSSLLWGSVGKFFRGLSVKVFLKEEWQILAEVEWPKV